MYELARKSIMKFVIGTIAALNAEAGAAGTMSYIDFDAHGEVDELPPTDVAGIHQFALTDHANYWEIVFGVTVSSYDDPNLLNLIHYVDRFFSAMGAQQLIPLYDPVSAALVGQFTIYAGTGTTPTERANTRPVVSIHASGRLVLTT